jgi:hypothetical protein
MSAFVVGIRLGAMLNDRKPISSSRGTIASRPANSPQSRTGRPVAELGVARQTHGAPVLDQVVHGASCGDNRVGPWMTLYFSVCVWWSLALVHAPRLEEDGNLDLKTAVSRQFGRACDSGWITSRRSCSPPQRGGRGSEQ